MIQDYQNKNVLAAMKRQLNANAKQSIREARINFVLIHLLSEHHDLMLLAKESSGKKNLFDYICFCLSRFADDMEMEDGPLQLYRKDDELATHLMDVVRLRTPAKDAVQQGLEGWQEWPPDIPCEEWAEEALQTAYVSLFGLYYFDTPVKDMMRWLGKNEPKNPKFVNAMNRHETATNIMHNRKPAPPTADKIRKTMYLSEDQIKEGYSQVEELKEMFTNLYCMLARGDTLRFCQEKTDTAFEVFLSGTFAMMLPGDDVNRDGMASKEGRHMVYQAAKKTILGKELVSQIVTNDDDRAAEEVFYWGLVYGKQGVDDGSLPIGMGEFDVRRKPGPKRKKRNDK